MRFGRRVKELRMKQGWTQVEFAERLGLDRSYIADIERGNRNVSLANIEIIAKGFSMTLAKLLARV